MKLTQTKLRGDFVACSLWLLPDNTVRAVKFAHDEHESWHAERHGQGDPHAPPVDGAVHLQTLGQIPAVDTPDGFPLPGMWWRQGSRTVVQLGEFPVGNWHYHNRVRDPETDSVTGFEINAVNQRWSGEGELPPDAVVFDGLVPSVTIAPVPEGEAHEQSPVFDANVGTQDTSFAGTITTAITVSSSANRYMLSAIGNELHNSTTITSVKYATVALAALGSSPVLNTAAGGTETLSLDVRGLLAPASGGNNMVLVWSASFYGSMEYTSYTGVDQSTPIGTPAAATGGMTGGASTTAQVAVSSATGELTFFAASHMFWDSSFVYQSTTTATASGLTERGQVLNTDAQPRSTRTCVGDQAGAATVTAGWALSKDVAWSVLGVSLKPVGGGASAWGAQLSDQLNRIVQGI